MRLVVDIGVDVVIGLAAHVERMPTTIIDSTTAPGAKVD
jgi:hypothetical protein